MVPTGVFQAYWTSSSYQKVAEYSPQSLRVTNLVPGSLLKNKIVLEQGSKDFGIKNEYQLTITPSNPIPKIGMVEIVMPSNVEIPPDDEFVSTCSIITTAKFGGENHCKLFRKHRTFILYNAFLDTDDFQTEFTIFFTLTNPTNNFDSNENYDSSFHINTHSFTMVGDEKVIKSGYKLEEAKVWADSIL